MPSRDRVEVFVDAVVNGDHADAIRNFYHEDASMQENETPPRVGRDHLVAHEQAALARVQSMETHPPRAVLVDGDQVMIAWTFDMTDGKGVRRRLREIALQEWRDDRILREQFVYDTATAWKPVKDGA